jgi:signal peptidase
MTMRSNRPRRSAAARIGSGLVNVLMIAATIAGVGYLAPSLFGYERYVITGGSMSGTFEKGSVAIEKPVPVENLKIGDVITYLPPADSGVAHLVTHRIISDTVLPDGSRQLQTQGDANPDPDPWKFSLTVGTQPVVRTTIPHVGWVFVALADRDIRMIDPRRRRRASGGTTSPHARRRLSRRARQGRADGSKTWRSRGSRGEMAWIEDP